VTWLPSTCSSKGRSTVIKAHTGGVRCVAFSPDSTSLLSSSDDKTIKMWSISGHKFKQTLSGHSNWVRAARFNPTGDVVVSGGDDKTVRIWDVGQRQCVHTFHDHTGPVNDVTFHPDGLCVAACSSDNTIKIWDLRMNQLLQHYSAHLDAVNSIAIHPSGDYMVSGSSDMTTKIWDLREGHLCYTLHGHEGAVNSVAFSPAGDYFASASKDENLLVWKTNLVPSDGDAPGAAAEYSGAPGREGDSMDDVQTEPEESPREDEDELLEEAGADDMAMPMGMSMSAQDAAAYGFPDPAASYPPGIVARPPAPSGQRPSTAWREAPPPQAPAGYSAHDAPGAGAPGQGGAVEAMLAKVLSQLETLSTTVKVLDRRMAITEDRVRRLDASR